MKREIKFRVWSGEQMVSPDYIDRDGVAHWKENSIPETSDELMQFTGLEDKNGKEIYEGDIVQWEDTVDDGYGCGYLTKIQEEVIFGGGAYNPISTMPSKYFEVIGNVYENPELLKA